MAAYLGFQHIKDNRFIDGAEEVDFRTTLIKYFQELWGNPGMEHALNSFCSGMPLDYDYLVASAIGLFMLAYYWIYHY